MNRNYIPYLKYNEFEEEFADNHFHTGNDFFTIDKIDIIYESNKKNIGPNHVSEINHIIPENVNYFDNRKIYKNNIFIETKELTPQNNNFLYSSKNIHLDDDRNYQKYLLNIKDGNNSNKKKLNKKNNSQNKIANLETYNIIQIYEAPPLELTPISENEKNESIEKRKPPKYFRKKKIYTLEETNTESKNKTKLFDLDYNELEKISQKFDSKEHENNPFLRAIKSSNSKNKKRLYESKDNTENNINTKVKEKDKDNKDKDKDKDKDKENEKPKKNYSRYLTKELKPKTELKINDNITNNIKTTNNTNNNTNNNNLSINTNINYKKYIKNENENEKDYNNYNYNTNYNSNKT